MQAGQDENPCSTNRQDCRFGPHSDPVGVAHKDVRHQSCPLRQNQTGPDGAHFVLGEACLLEEPTCSNCEGVYVTRKLQAHACRELLSEIIVTCDLKVGIATIKVNVVN